MPVKATAETVDQRTNTVLISVGDLLLDGVLICGNPDEQIRDHHVGTSSPMILSIDIWTAANRSRASAQSLPAPTTIVDFLSLMTRAWSGATQFLGDQLLTIQNTHTTITIMISDAIKQRFSPLTHEERADLQLAGVAAAQLYIQRVFPQEV